MRHSAARWAMAAALALAMPAMVRSADLPAFPGAEGYGAASAGGRGGKVLHVTKLTGDGPGTLQWACDQEGPRIVVFDVGGVIVPPHENKVRRYLAIHHGGLTIAGQTAPPPGITIEGTISTLRGTTEKPVEDVVIRFVRVRPRATQRGNLRSLELSNSKRVIADHVSGSWSIDDCFDLYTGSDATIQWCTVEESDIQLEGGDEPHNFGVILGYGKSGPRAITLHHNLIANHHNRAPLSGNYPLDLRNNLLYNVGSGMDFLVWKDYADKHMANIVGNTSRVGPGGPIGVRIYRPPYTRGAPRIGPTIGRFYLDGNEMPWLGGFVQPWAGDQPHPGVVDKPLEMAPVTTHTAGRAADLVLTHAGCLPRDSVSQRTRREVITGTGYWGRHEPDAGLLEGLPTGEAPADSDGDGMPDAWESARGLDPKDPADAGRTVPAGASPGDRHKGYTFIEYYINELADTRVAEAMTEVRLNGLPDRPWDRPATRLSPMATPHESIEQMLAAIREQDMARHADPQKKYDTHAAWYAVQQLSRMGEAAKPAVAPLIELAAGDDLRQVSFAVWALGAIGKPAEPAVPALLRVMSKEWKVAHTKWNFCPACFAPWSLGRIDGDKAEVARALADFLGDREHPWGHDPALWALRQMGPVAEPALEALLARVERTHAAEALAGIGQPAVAPLVKLFEDRKAERRREAARALGLIGKAADVATEPLVKLLGDEDMLIRARAAEALGLIRPSDPAVVAALAKLLADNELTVRHRAAVALSRAGKDAAPAAAALGKAMTSDARAEVREAAADALSAIGPQAAGVLVVAATDSNEQVRAVAVRALGGVGEKAVDPLTAALADRSPAVRREAAWSLAQIGPAAAKAAGELRKACGDGDYVVRVAAADALGRVRKD